MFKKLQLFTLVFSGILLSAPFAAAQKSENIIPCYTNENLDELIKKDPSLIQKRKDFDAFMVKIAEDHEAGVNVEAGRSAPKIIPVVVHVIHEGGTENISKEQINDQLRILNEDLRRLNADTVNTPLAFSGVAADCNIEFKLAKKDPNGNCTNGIVRVLSPLTNGPLNRDDVKALSYWPSNRYFNIWVVKNIDAGGSAGTILGYAQFPFGAAATDGIVLRSDYTGSIETGNLSYKGRTATHEVGHWLGLRHIWGDATCGNDNVNDTPKHRTTNYGCPNFPQNSNLCVGTGPNGEMFMDYMDYSNGTCMNMFTDGQKAVMDGVFGSFRANLISASNLTATGVNDPDILCKAEFMAKRNVICAGEAIDFIDDSFTGQTSWTWNFPGGSPSSSGNQNPSITYSTPGIYNVTLTVNDDVSTKTITKTSYITVLPDTGRAIPIAEGFETISFPNNDWTISNNGGSVNWSLNSSAAATGTKSLKLNNVSSPLAQMNEFISSTIDLSSLSAVTLSFKVAFAQKSSSNNDKLVVFVSNNCGKNWAMRLIKTGSVLATAPVQTTAFIPSASQWKTYTISDIPSSYLTEDFRLKFQFTNGGGNNIYIDDINLYDPAATDMTESLSSNLNFMVFPNPAEENTIITFNLMEQQNVLITLTDILGRKVSVINNSALIAGEYRFDINNKDVALVKGVYIVKIIVNDRPFTKKLVMN